MQLVVGDSGLFAASRVVMVFAQQLEYSNSLMLKKDVHMLSWKRKIYALVCLFIINSILSLIKQTNIKYHSLFLFNDLFNDLN